MRLAGDDISVMVGSERFTTLKPTLRAATRLERQLDGYEALCARILAGNFSLIISIIVETSATPITTAQIHAALQDRPLGEHLPDLMHAALSIVAKLAGHDADAPDAASNSNNNRTSYRQLHRELFRIAAGNLGWSPDQAWNATPAEILEAYRGRNDLLRSIFGGSDSDGETQAQASAPSIDGKLDRAGLDKLRGKGRLV
jgi:hypothetical protein